MADPKPEPKSLFEALGLKDEDIPKAPFIPGVTPPDPVPGGPPPFEMPSARQFALEILTSPQYRASLQRRIMFDELPPAVECLLYHHAFGKPTEHVEVTETQTPLEDLTVDQLEDRALRLAEWARHLREQAHVSSSTTIQ